MTKYYSFKYLSVNLTQSQFTRMYRLPLFIFILSFCIATPTHGQKLRRMTLGDWTYKQPANGRLLDSANVYGFNFVSSDNQPDQPYFKLAGLRKSFDEHFDFFIELEELKLYESDPKLKTRTRKIKRENEEDSVVTKYFIKSRIHCEYRLIVFSYNFDTLFVSTQSDSESYSTDRFLDEDSAWSQYDRLTPPYAQLEKNVCKQLVNAFNNEFRDQIRTVKFRVYESRMKSNKLFHKGYENLIKLYNHKRWDKTTDAKKAAEDAIFYFNACLSEIDELKLTHARKQKLIYAIHFNLGQIQFLMGDFTSMYGNIEKAISGFDYPKNYEKKMHQLAYTCASRLDFISHSAVFFE